MQLTRRHLGPAELDYELIWLVVSIGSVGLAAIWLCLGLPWPICLFHQLTGHPCATCGSTRAAIAFFHGDLLGSIRWNPLAFALYCSIAAFDVYALGVLVTRARRLRVSFSGVEKTVLRGVAIGGLLLNWAYLLEHSRMFQG